MVPMKTKRREIHYIAVWRLRAAPEGAYQAGFQAAGEDRT